MSHHQVVSDGLNTTGSSLNMPADTSPVPPDETLPSFWSKNDKTVASEATSCDVVSGGRMQVPEASTGGSTIALASGGEPRG